jgi:hypothetical protein
MYVIETKWRKSRANINDVDGLRSRLERARSGITGVLVSTSGFSAAAITAVAARRDRPLLLIDGEDLERLCDRRADLRRLLRTKEDALVLRGEVLLPSQPPSRRGGRRPRALPATIAIADRFMLGADGSWLPWVTGHGGFGEFTFIGEHHDPDWGTAGAGVMLDLPLPLEDAAGVQDVLAELSSLGWIGGMGQWCILQAERNWHGVGAPALAEALDAWPTRYAGAGRIHHSEQVRYHDVCEDGFYTLSFDASALEPRRVHRASMSVQLAGIPLDIDPIRELCRTLDVQTHVAFRPRIANAFTRSRVDKSGGLELVASVVEERTLDPDARVWTCGVVVRNPYYGTVAVDCIPDDLRAPASESELLVCELRSWHPFGEAHAYDLCWWEWAWTSDGLVVRVMADWVEESGQREVDIAFTPREDERSTSWGVSKALPDVTSPPKAGLKPRSLAQLGWVDLREDSATPSPAPVGY